MSDNKAKIIMAGFGGQGIVLIGNVIARACVIEDKNVVGMVSYGAEMRGGTANASVVISDAEIADPFVTTPSHAIILNHPSLERFEADVAPGGLMLLNTSLMQRSLKRSDLDSIEVSATDIAHELGNLRVANIVALGAFVKHTELVTMAGVEQGIRDLFSTKKTSMIDLNLQALAAGAEQSRFIPAGANVQV
ncbi:MAG: 2-oxoacid:acceptor oxidoreductase family protein [Planctomycetota bacterium]|jgi:2-oxoglutarate ferredoxin oxidoreductase subunit gamma